MKYFFGLFSSDVKPSAYDEPKVKFLVKEEFKLTLNDSDPLHKNSTFTLVDNSLYVVKPGHYEFYAEKGEDEMIAGDYFIGAMLDEADIRSLAKLGLIEILE